MHYSLRKTLLSLLGLAVVAAALLLAYKTQEQARSTPGIALADKPQGGDFTLQSAAGPLSSRAYRGQVLLIYFGYTYCPDICPTSLATAAAALESLSPAELGQVQGLFISVDPERDTPARLKDYAAFFHPKILGATGSVQEVAAVAQAYGASYARQEVKSEGGYVVDHSSSLYLVAPDGHLAAALPHGTPPADVAQAIRSLLPRSPS
ncbi:MAG TPA: SCO family protein [Azospira sp.]|nr:SCO family protein [Azospira sp.]